MLNRKIEEVQLVETLLEQYKSNKAKIKLLEENNNKIKNQILEHYMKNEDTLRNSEGITLATYKSSIRTTFQTKKFESDYKELYEEYLDLAEVKVFLVK